LKDNIDEIPGLVPLAVGALYWLVRRYPAMRWEGRAA